MVSNKSVSWHVAFESALGDLQSFLRDHDRFTVQEIDHKMSISLHPHSHRSGSSTAAVRTKQNKVSHRNVEQWPCAHCTFLNEPKHSKCEICTATRSQPGDEGMHSNPSSSTGKRKHGEEHLNISSDGDSDCMIIERGFEPAPKRRKLRSGSPGRNALSHADDAWNSCLSSHSDKRSPPLNANQGLNLRVRSKSRLKSKSKAKPTANPTKVRRRSDSRVRPRNMKRRGSAMNSDIESTSSSDGDIPVSTQRNVTRNNRRRRLSFVSDDDTTSSSEDEHVRPKQSTTKALTTYYKNKQKLAERAKERFYECSTNRRGQRIIKLPIDTECTEYRSGTVFISDFGRIPSDPAKALKYCDKDYIYPIGLKAYRVHPSTLDPRKETRYFMEILDDGMEGPTYKVYAEDDESVIYQDKKATPPWEAIIDKISEKAKEIGCDGARNTHGTSGKRYLGLRDYFCMGVIELLPNAQLCTTYWKHQRKHDIPPKPFFTNVQWTDIVIQGT